MRMSQLERNIRKNLDAVLNDLDLNDAGGEVWTRKVKTALCEACREVEDTFYLYATGVDCAEKEWLYDVSCLEYKDDPEDGLDRCYHRLLKRIVMVAECEWGDQGRIFDDFEKLLLARADLRVMLFEGNTLAKLEDRFQPFLRYIAAYRDARIGDTWLLAAFGYDEDENGNCGNRKFDYCRIEVTGRDSSGWVCSRQG